MAIWEEFGHDNGPDRQTILHGDCGQATAMTTPTLKPCPFPTCGSADVQILGGNTPRLCYVACSSCHTMGPTLSSDAAAAAAWNAAPRLTPPDPHGRQHARVRVAVAVTDGGEWTANGWGYMSGEVGHPGQAGWGDTAREQHERCALGNLGDPQDYQRAHVVWLTGLVPLPPEGITGEVEA